MVHQPWPLSTQLQQTLANGECFHLGDLPAPTGLLYGGDGSEVGETSYGLLPFDDAFVFLPIVMTETQFDRQMNPKRVRRVTRFSKHLQLTR